MKLILAPMDGLTDSYARELLTAIGGYDLCITEFLRVTDTLFPKRVFYRRFPELNPEHCSPKHQQISHTPSGVPVFLQLLGSDNTALAENAARAVQLGAAGIDLNFGCPAKTINRRLGGASLLKYPQRINAIISSVRQAVPEHIPVTAKMRLGYDDQSLAHENALAIQEGGANWLTIHARTKKEAYHPPAHWHALSAIKQLLYIPIIANGEVWSVEDYLQCRTLSGCDSVMLGRGAMVTPDLARQIKAHLGHQKNVPLDWTEICQLLTALYQLMRDNNELDNKYIAPRLKLWVKWLMPTYTQAEEIFGCLKHIKDPQQAITFIHSSASK